MERPPDPTSIDEPVPGRDERVPPWTVRLGAELAAAAERRLVGGVLRVVGR
jgi:hypothetical protein